MTHSALSVGGTWLPERRKGVPMVRNAECVKPLGRDCAATITGTVERESRVPGFLAISM